MVAWHIFMHIIYSDCAFIFDWPLTLETYSSRAMVWLLLFLHQTLTGLQMAGFAMKNPLKLCNFQTKNQQLANCCNTSFFATHSDTCAKAIRWKHTSNAYTVSREFCFVIFDVLQTEIVHVNISDTEWREENIAGIWFYLCFCSLALCRFAFLCAADDGWCTSFKSYQKFL